jgi:alpha-beta hydrolase superfamily lysophospholipase
MGARAQRDASLNIPVIVLTGEKDPIGTAGVGQRAFTRFLRSVPSQHKEWQRFDDGYHDLIHDSNTPRAIECVGDWMEHQLAMPEASLARGGARRDGRSQGL